MAPTPRSEAVQALVERHRRHVELSPGVGHDAQQYAIAVCDDILAELAEAAPPLPDTRGLVERLEEAVDGCKYSCAANMAMRMETLVKVAREAIAALAPRGGEAPPVEPPKRWTEVLCMKCGGNGVIKIPGGVSQCPRCDGRCYEPEVASRGPAQAQGWQPIATAPKRLHSCVLLWWTTRGASSGYWDVDEDRDKCGWRGDQDLVIPRDQDKCTHWMPLPSPPTAAEGEPKQ